MNMPEVAVRRSLSNPRIASLIRRYPVTKEDGETIRYIST